VHRLGARPKKRACLLGQPRVDVGADAPGFVAAAQGVHPRRPQRVDVFVRKAGLGEFEREIAEGRSSHAQALSGRNAFTAVSAPAVGEVRF